MLSLLDLHYIKQSTVSCILCLIVRSSRPEVFLRKGVLKICCKFTGEHAQHGCSPVNLLHIFRKPFPKNTAGRLLLNCVCEKQSVNILNKKESIQ